MAGRASVQGERKGFALPQVPKIAVYIVGFIPAVWLFYAGIDDRLGADPMRYLEQALGLWALRFLIATLAITPLRQLFNINLLRYRRALGLLAFYYAALHLTTYLVLDQGLDMAAIVADIVKRPYITIGMATFVILIPLAVTSNNAAIRRMGGQAWAKLHRLVYLAAIGAALHFLLVVKSWPPEPIVYAAIVAVLLGYRLVRPMVKKPSPRRRAA
ncbi:protein-methionine-sulfoxide reductase heme-binding subunit MsrQ [Microvirga mediterraneensis]|uniref:Protein-methionine-sulfoxide reductase heme-binding subunit MsrQ n=1 Tax=Microvirga mediterraneensis TaxID=2754695 RepID=A0A838BKW9_9HYPH|nr:protein-methionine-sulfoxide reductase heme-binding subunit MsrQ [Microvirga mediterraneensis]MBA1156304.1 protein-methionine-sulfoxide reductase heme-binding subunit MsrQ [Microvirga mediterraneensis]